MAGSAYCRYQCGARILFAYTVRNGKPIPLNYDPDPTGNVAVSKDERNVLMARVVGRPAGSDDLVVPGRGETIYMPHHATCPNKPAAKAKPVEVSRRRRPRFVDTDAQLDLFTGDELAARRRSR